jgi:hypothetical protein
LKALAGLLCVLLAGCATPQSSSPSPSPSASITFTCDPIYCSDVPKGGVLEGGVLTAVAGLGYPVKTVTIGVFNYSCGVPDLSGTAPPCPATTILPTAYVSFVGTDKIATVKVGTVIGDSVVSFEVPPAGPSFP